MNVVFSHIVRIEPNKPSSRDQRKKMDWILVSYTMPDGGEWRTAFWVERGTGHEKISSVPAQGAQNEIIALAYAL